MPTRLAALCIDANDPRRLTDFWAGLLRREVADDGVTIEPSDDVEFSIVFRPTSEPKVGPGQMHLHLTSAAEGDQQETVARALRLGGRADPDGAVRCDRSLRRDDERRQRRRAGP